MKVTVASRSGREVIKGGLELSDSATVADLQEAIHKRTKKFYPSRQRLTLPLPPGSKERPVVLSYKKNLKEYSDGNLGNLTVVFKDLGPQVSYRTLFFCEYLGPLVLHATSPLSNVFRNCAYYWTFGSFIAYYVNHPLYTPVSDLQMKIGFGFGLMSYAAESIHEKTANCCAKTTSFICKFIRSLCIVFGMHLAGREYKVIKLKRFRISSFFVPKRTRPCDSYASTGSVVPVKRKGPSEPLKRTPTIMCWKR
ncbi:hypothetical protein D5086_020666 [Populus alba]|uniref:Uncharacterized protein n=1 Tax=Populus alba TaxID=43335 RepID=A0ACC4BKQ5_POPAL